MIPAKKINQHQYERYYRAVEEFTKKPATTIYSGTIFTFLAVSLFGWYAIRPTIQTILLLRREIADDTIVSQRMGSKIENLIEAQATYQAIAGKIPLLTKAIPEDPAVTTLVRQLQNVASVSNASISAITVSPVPISTGEENGQTNSAPTGLTDGTTSTLNTLALLKIRKYTSVPMTIVITGNYASLKSYLERILSLQRILTIDTIHFMAAKTVQNDTSTNDVMLQLAIKINAYYFDQEEGHGTK